MFERLKSWMKPKSSPLLESTIRLNRSYDRFMEEVHTLEKICHDMHADLHLDNKKKGIQNGTH